MPFEIISALKLHLKNTIKGLNGKLCRYRVKTLNVKIFALGHLKRFLTKFDLFIPMTTNSKSENYTVYNRN